jgi:hypothetical protein
MISSKGTYTLSAYRDADRFALVAYNTLLADVETSHYQPDRVGLFTGILNQPENPGRL